MKKKVFKYAMVSVLFLLTILGIKSVSAEVYEGQAIWPSEFIPNIYIRKTRNDGYIKYQQAQFIRRSEDNKFLYCLQPYVDIDNNLPYYNVARSDYETVLNMSKEQWNRISLLAYYGYTYDANGYDHSEHKWYAITQVMIWRTTNPDSKIVFTDTLNGNTIESKFANEIAEIENLVANHYKTPNFNVDNITIPLGQSVTLTDVNGVLGNYKINGTKNVSATINGNTITITATNVGDASIDLIKKTTVYETNPIVYFSNHSQNVMRVGNYDPVLSSTNAKIIGGRVTTEKVDSLTELTTPRGDGQLVGSIFGVYTDDDKRVGQVTIGENSVGTSDYLPSLGKFYLKEEIAGTGYTVSDEKIYFEITEDNLNPKVTVKEQIIEKDVELFKMFADGTTTILTGEPNITFEFYLKSSMELYASATTNEKGRLLVRLPYGRYVVKQVNTTPNYEKVDDFEIVIDDSKEEIITKIITNAEITAKLKLVKVDSITNKIIKRNGIKFKIKNLDTNEYVCQTISYPSQQKVCEFKTVDGVFITPYVLSSGNYQIEEIEDQIIPGYIWNRNPLKFSIGESSTFIQDEDNGLLLEVFFENTEVRGAFELTKLGEKLVLENDSYRYDEIKLDGVLFDLYADEDIYSADGTLVYKKNDIVESFKTVDGYYKNDKLHLGSYCVKEKESVLDNMVIDTPYCFTLSYKDQYTEVISTSFTVKNELEKGTLVFSKTDLGGKPIPNTWIEIYSDKDDESTLIYSGYTDEEGKIVLEKLFVGKGHIIEKEAADGFQITDEIVYFEIKENGEIVKANMTNEQIVEVPNTYKNDSKVIPIISITLMVAGLGAVIYASKKKRK